MAAARNIQKRTEILKGAYRLFSASGYARVSLSDIAKSAGINKSLLQSYYPQKQQIVGELLGDMLRQSFLYMETYADDRDQLFYRLSDYTTLFFLSVDSDPHLNYFIHTTTSHTELMDIWVDTVFQWFWEMIGSEKQAGAAGQSAGLTYLRAKAALSFAMYGSLKLLRDQNELNLTVQEIFENHIRQLMSILGNRPTEIERVLAHTRSRAAEFDTNAFLQYCEERIPWFTR